MPFADTPCPQSPTPRDAPRPSSLQPRQNALSCITANVTAWGAIVLEAPKPFAATQSLNFWMRGSGATSFALYLEDSVNRRFSRWVQPLMPYQLLCSTRPGQADPWQNPQPCYAAAAVRPASSEPHAARPCLAGTCG